MYCRRVFLCIFGRVSDGSVLGSYGIGTVVIIRMSVFIVGRFTWLFEKRRVLRRVRVRLRFYCGWGRIEVFYFACRIFYFRVFGALGLFSCEVRFRLFWFF